MLCSERIAGKAHDTKQRFIHVINQYNTVQVQNEKIRMGSEGKVL